jgi:hypothetical protein
MSNNKPPGVAVSAVNVVDQAVKMVTEGHIENFSLPSILELV